MIAHTTLLLFFIGLFSSIKVGVKVDKALSFLTFASLFLLFINFFDNVNSVDEHVFSFIWNTASNNKLKFDIISNNYNYWLILPCFTLTVLSAFNNVIFRYEERRSAYLAILIFNLIALIILITSNNFVQLLSAIFVIDILSIFMIKNVNAYRRYVLLNLLADIVLFTVLAIINCRVASLDIRQIVLYRNIGMHQDFVSIAGLTAVFAKLGFLWFQVGMVDLKKIRFHRMQNMLFLSSPLAAMIILLKFSALWRTSAYFTDYMDFVCTCAIVWGGFGGLLADNFKAKVIYWQMSSWAMFIELLRFHGFIWFSGFTFLFMEMYALVMIMYLFYYYNQRKELMSQIMDTPLIGKNKIICSWLILVITIGALANTLALLYNNMNRSYIWTFSIMFLLSLSAVIKQLTIGRQVEKNGTSDKTSPKSAIFIEIILLCLFLLQDYQYKEPVVWFPILVFIFLCWCNPLSRLSFVYNIDVWQNGDVLGRFYHILIKSLRLCGKFFWLLIDRLFMEKVVLNLLSSILTKSLRFFRMLHDSKLGGGMTVVVLIIVLLWYSYYNAEVRYD